jgi:hypothetical protein
MSDWMYDELEDYEIDVEDWLDEFNDKAKYIKVYPNLNTAIDRALLSTFEDDLELL